MQAGATFWIQFVATDPNTGDPVNVTSPKMEVREAPPNSRGSSTSRLLYSSEANPATVVITQPTANTVLATFPSSATKNITGLQTGYWDCYATDPNGNELLLGSGSFTAAPNVTVL